MTRRSRLAIMMGLAGFLVAGEALAERSCATYWSDKRWSPDGANNNAWVARCQPGGINQTWVDQQSARQYVVCYKFDSSAGPMAGHVFEPTFTLPIDTINRVPCRTDIVFSELLYKDCLDAREPVKFGGQYQSIADAAKAGVPTVTALASRPGLEGSKFAEQPILRYIPTPVVGKILSLKLDRGIEILLTGNHPMVLSDGRVTQAEKLHAGDALLRSDGDVDSIATIGTVPYNGTVWTVRPKSEKKIENVLVVRDVLTGSSRYTEEWAHDETRLVRARTINVDGL